MCVAAVCSWVRTLDRFTTFDGLSGAVIFHMSRNTEVLPITVTQVHILPNNPQYRGALILSVIPEEVCIIYIYLIYIDVHRTADSGLW